MDGWIDRCYILDGWIEHLTGESGENYRFKNPPQHCRSYEELGEQKSFNFPI